jgi:2-methylisocitrate lyase-like PEP mutase family enzyme
MMSVANKRAEFQMLHQSGCFVIPNPWDRGSARFLQHLGFSALASTSSGYAWTTGRPDYAVTKEEVLKHLSELCEATDLPINADFESGFASEPEGVATNVALAIETGVAGLSIEDRQIGGKGLFDLPFAVERIKAARAAIDQSGQGVILVARTEGLLTDATALKTAIDKLVAFADAGADCLYAPGVQDKPDIGTMVRAVSPKPLNVLMFGRGLSVAELADLGVRRISIGGALARVYWGAVEQVAKQIRAGCFDGLANSASGRQLNEIFGSFATQL